MKITEQLRLLLSSLPKKVKLKDRYVGPGEPVFVIAEIGINHNGDMDIARKLIDVAVEAGADAVKFQKRTTSEILTKEGREKPYTSPHAYAETYGAHRDKLELSVAQHAELKAYAEGKGIQFFASVWDHTSADDMESLGIDAYKIPSADITNLPLLEYVAKKNRPVLLSTGMSSMEEIIDAVGTILPFNKRIILFHCLSLYPAPEEKIGMRFMEKLAERFAPLPYGYSGHEIDALPTLMAVAQGAQIIERHLTLDKTMKGSDHSGSLNPQEFIALMKDIRRIERINGTGEKVLYPELIPLREKLGKSVVAKKAITKGEVITADHLTVKGPGTGIMPRDMASLVGKVAQADIPEDTHLPKEALEW